MTNFEKYTSSPGALEKLLKEVSVRDERPWEVSFRMVFCCNCCLENCPEVCPHEEKRDNPGWWLGLEAEHGDV